MIKKRNILFSSIFIISILTVSCTSTRYYGINTTDLRTQLTGNILVKPKNTDFYDIILDGETKLDIGFENLASGETQFMKWNGNIGLAESMYDIQIRYKQYFGEKGVTHILSISIENLPPIYKFNAFDITGSTAIWDKYVYESDLPVMLTAFSIGGKGYTLLLTSMNTVSTMKNSMDSYLGLMSTDKQVFHIIDEKGEIHAEFTKDYYRIFDVESEIDSKLLWPCIASFSIIRNICAERQRTNPF